jgi:hypothetical protein
MRPARNIDCDVSVIDQFYNDILCCMKTAVAHCIPCRRIENDSCGFNVPGWNTYVREKHDIAREAFLNWSSFGKPKSGALFEAMRKTKAVFKLAVRYCKNHVEQMRADACAESLYDKDARKFWISVCKLSNSKAKSHVIDVGGASGSVNVTNMWQDHFKDLYNCKINSKYRADFEAKLAELAIGECNMTVNVLDVRSSISKQKHGKAVGPDGLQMESFIYGGHRLNVYLTILFNIFFKFGYVPSEFCSSAIIPLVKNKNSDLTDVNNYRAIAISKTLSKVLAHVMFEFLETTNIIDMYQFGFKKHLSTGLCTDGFKRTVNFYRENGSHVFTCFIDFTKAFDNVDYWLLFCKLLDSKNNAGFNSSVRLLSYWYSHQSVFVKWHDCESQMFGISNGVRQGGVLSPYLFIVYIRDLLLAVIRSGIGCCIAGTTVNLFAYADDIVLVAPSWRGLQSLLTIIERVAFDIGLNVNLKKTVCMIFNPTDKKKIISNSFPNFKLAGHDLAFVSQFRYLGHIIDQSMIDDKDIMREIKAMFTRANLLCRKFKRCSVEVKIKLFKSYIICLYDSPLWSNYTSGILNKLASCYVKCMKIFFGYNKYSSVTGMLIDLGLPSFNTVLHNNAQRYNSRLLSCSNNVVNCVAHLHS